MRAIVRPQYHEPAHLIRMTQFCFREGGTEPTSQG